jgi:putative transposase
VVSPQAKRQCVAYLVAEKDYSQRRACQLVRIHRSSARYEPSRKADEVELREEIRGLANRNKTYGYRRISALLRREGSKKINKKRVHRIWKAEGLQLTRKKPRKRRFSPKGEVIHKAERRNHVWSYDFLEDRTEKGGKLRILTVMDEFTRESLAILVGRSIPSAQVIHLLEWLFLVQGTPEHLRSDNGPELVAQAVQDWLAQCQCQTIYITPGSPWENPYIESFNGKFRAECLDRYVFANVQEAQEITENWRYEYNHYRPHSSLGYLTPVEFSRLCLKIPKKRMRWLFQTQKMLLYSHSEWYTFRGHPNIT